MKKLVSIPAIILYIWVMKTIYIYEIVNPITQAPFYIGQTVNPYSRFKEHKFKKYRGNKEKIKVINEIKAQGLMPIFNILKETTDPKEADRLETALIAEYGKNHKLVNVFVCGKLGFAETRKRAYSPDPKLSARSTGKMPVSMISKNGETIATFESITQAASETGIAKGSIASIARGETRRKTAGGYVWKYT